MSTSQKTFEQVKSILGKLDRDIDAARVKRLQRPSAPMPAIAAAPVAAVLSAPHESNGALDPGRSGFGRARAMRADMHPGGFQSPNGHR